MDYSQPSQGLSAVPQRESELSREFNTLIQNVEKLEQLAENFSVKLAPILSGERPKNEGQGKPENNSALAKELGNFNRRLTIVKEKFGDMFERIEL